MAEIKIEQNLNVMNDETADKNRRFFKMHGIFVLNILGSPGAGKTTLLENMLPELKKSYEIAVIEGDLATQNDAERVRALGVTALQINTDGGCHLDARMIEGEMKKLDPEKTELLIIENVGNLVCPVEFDLGENLRLVILSTPEGEDKPLKYPPAMLHTDAVVLSKTDLAPYVDVDIEKMKRNVAIINPKAAVLETCKKDGTFCTDAVIDYLKGKIEAEKPR